MGDSLYKKVGAKALSRIFPGDPQVQVERPLWDSVAQEPARLAGTKIQFWSARTASNRHPLYGEPSDGGSEWEFSGPWELWADLEFDQAQEIEPQAQTEGFVKESNAKLWVARKEFEDVNAPNPKIGDVIGFWDLEPFSAREGRYWNIMKANRGGNVFSSETFVHWSIDLTVNTRFNPLRKIENVRI